jgi:hypothetical protein
MVIYIYITLFNYLYIYITYIYVRTHSLLPGHNSWPPWTPPTDTAEAEATSLSLDAVG